MGGDKGASLRPTNLVRRPAALADTDFARNAHHAAYRDVVVQQFGEWDESRQDDFFANDWAGASFEIIEVAGEPCGYVAIESRDGGVHVRELVVLPEYQNRGIGTAVLESAIATAEASAVPVVLGALHANRAAVLYRRLGFEEFDRTATHTMFRRQHPLVV